MTNINKGLRIAEKSVFAIAGILSFVSTFLPVFTEKSGTMTVAATTFFSFNLFPFFSFLALSVGFALALFGDGKRYAIGVSVSLAPQFYYLSYVLTYLVNILPTTLTEAPTPGSGAILMFVGIGLAAVSVLIHAILELLGKSEASRSNQPNDVEGRIALLKEYMKYKEEGLITEEEYQAKKASILGFSLPKKEKEGK